MSLINELMIEMRHPSQLPLEELKPQVDGGASASPELRVRPLPYATTARTRLRFPSLSFPHDADLLRRLPPSPFGVCRRLRRRPRIFRELRNSFGAKPPADCQSTGSIYYYYIVLLILLHYPRVYNIEYIQYMYQHSVYDCMYMGFLDEVLGNSSFSVNLGSASDVYIYRIMLRRGQCEERSKHTVD